MMEEYYLAFAFLICDCNVNSLPQVFIFILGGASTDFGALKYPLLHLNARLLSAISCSSNWFPHWPGVQEPVSRQVFVKNRNTSNISGKNRFLPCSLMCDESIFQLWFICYNNNHLMIQSITTSLFHFMSEQYSSPDIFVVGFMKELLILYGLFLWFRSILCNFDFHTFRNIFYKIQGLQNLPCVLTLLLQ